MVKLRGRYKSITHILLKGAGDLNLKREILFFSDDFRDIFDVL